MTVEGKKLFSEKVSVGNIIYFFYIEESSDGRKYLVIEESTKVDRESKERNRVVIFREHIVVFNEGFKKAFNFMIKKGQSKANRIMQIRRKYKKAHTKWTEEDDILLRNEYNQGKSIAELAEIFQIKPSAIRSRLHKLGLLYYG